MLSLTELKGPFAIIDAAIGDDIGTLRKLVHIAREAGYRTILSGPVSDADTLKIVDCSVKESVNLVYYNDNTLYFDHKNPAKAVQAAKAFLDEKNKQIKTKFGVNPKDLQAMPGKYGFGTHNYIQNSVSPVHFTVHKIER